MTVLLLLPSIVFFDFFLIGFFMLDYASTLDYASLIML